MDRKPRGRCLQCGSTENLLSKRQNVCSDCNKSHLKQSRLDNPKRHIIYRIRGNAKIRGIECSITEADLPAIPEYCPVFPWIKLVYEVGNGRSDGSVSLDRINNSIGYVRGNVRFISNLANTLKSSMTDEQMIMLGKDASKR